MNKTALKVIISIVTIILLFALSFTLMTIMLNDSKQEEQEKLNIENDINNEIKQKNVVQEENKNKDFFEGKIIEIRGKELIVENPSHLVDYSIYESDTRWHYNHQITVDGKLYLTAGYLIETDNVLIKDYNGNKIDISNLKEGDTIKVYTKDLEYTINTIFTPLTHKNIILIEKSDN